MPDPVSPKAPPRRVLLVDDDADIREALSDTLRDAGFETAVATDGRQALDLTERSNFDVVVTDVQMKPMDGTEFLTRVRAVDRALPVVLMTAYGTVEQAVSSMLDGASHYLVKPFAIQELTRLIDRLCPPEADDSGLITQSPESRALLDTATLVAQTDAVVTLTGESGTGKEVFANYIHRNSPRRDQPFVAINCAAIPENMLEAILFGHVKGAYTGATNDNPGKFELAQGGTLLLDEVTEMSPELQAKLLRVLQEKEVERIGGKRPIKLDVRVIATTNRDLRDEVDAGRFREDLYYRLNVFPLRVPPLRERPLDIVPLASHMLVRHHVRSGPVPALTAEAEALLLAHAWPGNVRELENVIQRALIVCPGSAIEKQHLLLGDVAPASGASRRAADVVETPQDLHDAVLEQEKAVILNALTATTGNRSEAASRLGISPRTLRYKMARLRDAGVEIPRRFPRTALAGRV